MIPREVTARWAPEILLAMASDPAQPVRFNRLLTGIDGISDRVLTIRLRELSELGLVRREVTAGPPTQVRYALTAEGLRYVQPLRVLAELGSWTREAEAL